MREMTKTLHTKDYNALSLAQPTNFKSMLNTGALLWGTGCRIPHEEAARIIASTPYHFCFIDAVGFGCFTWEMMRVFLGARIVFEENGETKRLGLIMCAHHRSTRL